MSHFPNALVSNWQSAVAKVFARQPVDMGKVTHGDLKIPLISFAHPMLQAATDASDAHVKTMTNKAAEPAKSPVEECARAALAAALARLHGNHAAVIRNQAVLAHFGTCDPKWVECITEFVAHYAFTKHSEVPYRRWRKLDDFVEELTNQCKIGIIGDWGTNEERAHKALRKLAQRDLDLLIHLGDIYYSCSATEANAFYESMIRGFTGKKMPRVLTLCGNHDMYSGGAPYYALLSRLGQPASFFCLRNAKWQILAADTGYNDFDPTRVDTGETWIQHHDEGDPYSELDWHIDKFQKAGGRKTIFMSHHQPFTRNAPIGPGDVINHKLLDPLKPYLDQISLWLWGHEHNQSIFASFAGVQRGRCIGASAIPVPGAESLYDVPQKLQNQDVPQLANDTEDIKLQVDPELGLYNLGYAVVSLNGATGQADYFQYNSSQDTEAVMFQETF
jgi:3',5'-cyclic AMP phosphodiesterase CpdA